MGAAGTVVLVAMVGLACFGAGVIFNKQALNAANEAKLDAQNAFNDAKNEWQKFKAGAKHRLDQIFS